MPLVRFSPTARLDLADIFEFIARDKPIAASRWIDRIEERCDLIASTPDLGERRPEFGADIRCSLIGRYIIFYRSISGGIEIARVIAGDRDIRFL